MDATVVGADRLGNIPQVLKEHGIDICRHISGRDAADQRRVAALPRGTQLLILFTDFLNHNAMRGFRRAAQDQGVPGAGVPAIGELPGRGSQPLPNQACRTAVRCLPVAQEDD